MALLPVKGRCRASKYSRTKFAFSPIHYYLTSSIATATPFPLLLLRQLLLKGVISANAYGVSCGEVDVVDFFAQEKNPLSTVHLLTWQKQHKASYSDLHKKICFHWIFSDIYLRNYQVVFLHYKFLIKKIFQRVRLNFVQHTCWRRCGFSKEGKYQRDCTNYSICTFKEGHIWRLLWPES